MKLKKWKRGGGEFIGYAVAMVSFVSIVILLVGFFLLARTTGQMENAIDVISREVIVCESMDEAKTLAQEEADKYMANYSSVLKDGSVTTDVYFAPGSKQEWKKGNFITVYLSAYVDCRVPGVSGVKEVTAVMMIEREGD